MQASDPIAIFSWCEGSRTHLDSGEQKFGQIRTLVCRVQDKLRKSCIEMGNRTQGRASAGVPLAGIGHCHETLHTKSCTPIAHQILRSHSLSNQRDDAFTLSVTATRSLGRLRVTGVAPHSVQVNHRPTTTWMTFPTQSAKHLQYRCPASKSCHTVC